MAYATFGPITFSGLISPEAIRTKEDARYADVALASGRPRLQRIGNELTELAFSVRLHRQFAAVSDLLAQFRQAKEDGTLLPYNDGTGQLLGLYVITSLNVNVVQWDNNGQPVEAQVELTAREFYDPNATTTAQQQAQNDAFANDRRKVVPVRPVATLPERPSTTVSASARSADSHTLAALQEVKAAQADASSTAARLRKAKEQVEEAQAAVQKVVSNLQTYVNLAQKAPEMLAAAQQVAAAIPDVLQAIVSGNAGNAFAGLTGLGTLCGDMVGKGINIETLIAQRRL